MALSHAILTALLDQDLTGYELAKQFDVSLGFFWQASHQQIYQQLKVLSEDGLLHVTEVEQTGKPDKRVYGLTDQGRETLLVWVESETKRKPAKDDLFVKLYNLGTADRQLFVDAVIARLAEHENKLALYEKIRTRGYRDHKRLDERRQGRYLALLAGIYQERAYIQWCNDALTILQSNYTV